MLLKWLNIQSLKVVRGSEQRYCSFILQRFVWAHYLAPTPSPYKHLYLFLLQFKTWERRWMWWSSSYGNTYRAQRWTIYHLFILCLLYGKFTNSFILFTLCLLRNKTKYRQRRLFLWWLWVTLWWGLYYMYGLWKIRRVLKFKNFAFQAWNWKSWN